MPMPAVVLLVCEGSGGYGNIVKLQDLFFLSRLSWTVRWRAPVSNLLEGWEEDAGRASQVCKREVLLCIAVKVKRVLKADLIYVQPFSTYRIMQDWKRVEYLTFCSMRLHAMRPDQKQSKQLRLYYYLALELDMDLWRIMSVLDKQLLVRVRVCSQLVCRKDCVKIQLMNVWGFSSPSSFYRLGS